MKELVITHKVNAVSMPKIGCGLDKLEWPKVRQILTDVFKDLNFKITVYSLEKGKKSKFSLIVVESEVKKEIVSEGKEEVKLTTESKSCKNCRFT